MNPQADRVLRRFLAETKTLDLAWVEGLRKDFLVLLKNVDRVHTYRDLARFREAIIVFRHNFDELFFDRFLNHDVKNAVDQGADWAKWVNGKLRAPAWSFLSDMSSPGSYPDQYMTEGMCLARWQQEAPRWKSRVQRRARDFWAAMKEVIEWYEKYRETPSPGPTVEVPERYQTTLEGFRVTLHGYDIGYESEQTLAKFKEGLRHYRDRASRVAPILLKQQLPLIVEFEAQCDKGGQYNHDGTITFSASSVAGHPEGWKWVTHVMAHEMGHHLFRAYLSGAQEDFWRQTIRGDFGKLDIAELLAKWPGDAWAFDFPRKMTDDPILALQVAALTQNREYRDTQSREDFQKLYDSGVRTLDVPKTPITGYANKNAEEAFCETLGLLVAYGPQALHERVRWWLGTVMGNDVRVASRVV